MSPQALKENSTQTQEYNIPGIMLLSVDRRAELQTYLQGITDTTERNNQIEKFRSILSQAEGKDLTKAQPIIMIVEDLLDDQLLINKQKAAAGEKQAAAGEKQAAAGEKQTAAGEKQAAAGEKQAAAIIYGKADVKTVVAANERQAGLESTLRAAAALESNIISKGGKSTRDSLQSAGLDYDTTLATARADLASQGKDPRLAEAFVMLQHQDKILSHIPPANRADLQREFANLRDGLGLQGLPTRTPASVALADPKVTLESYSKIQQGFGANPPLIHASNGEIRTSRELVSGKSTIMTIDGARFRESRGIRIESPVPNTGAIGETQMRLNNAQATARMREPQINALARITLSEIRDLGTRDIRVDGATGEAQANRLAALSRATEELTVDPADAEGATKLRTNLTRFFTSETFKSLPDADRRQVSDRLRIYFESIQNQANLRREIIALEKSNPKALIQSKIANQDAVIDRNLTDINRIGLHHLGQNGYDRAISALSTVFKQQSLGAVDDTKPFDGRTTAALEATLLALIGQTRAQAYPDGSLSPEAIAKIQGLGAVSNERMNEAVKQSVHGD